MLGLLQKEIQIVRAIVVLFRHCTIKTDNALTVMGRGYTYVLKHSPHQNVRLSHIQWKGLKKCLEAHLIEHAYKASVIRSPSLP